MISSTIIASTFSLPEGRLTHQELCSRFGRETMDKIAESSGIYERRVAKNGECASDLAWQAAKNLIEDKGIDPASIDLVLFATQTPDYLLPTTACILQNRLGIPTNTAAFDINLGCSQYVYSLATAHSMLVSGLAQRALVMTGDTVSRIIHPLDRAVVPLFGDAGTATIIERVDEGGFLGFAFGTDGSGHQHLIWPTSGLREPKTASSAEEVSDKQGSVRRRDDMFMDGAAIFVFTLKTVPKLVQDLLKRCQLNIEDIDLFIFHQASQLIVETSAKKLGIPFEKLHFKLRELGNSGGSTVAIALTDAVAQGRVKPGMKIMLAAFGVGLSWAGAVIKWPG